MAIKLCEMCAEKNGLSVYDGICRKCNDELFDIFGNVNNFSMDYDGERPVTARRGLAS